MLNGYVIGRHQLHHGDALDVLRSMPNASVDAVVTDPPYPEVDRHYGRMTVPQWELMIHSVVRECRRILTPTGSAVFILQPNSERVGRLRPWLFDFISWCCREWNVVQDAWWWNHASPPTVHCHEAYGLMRPSLKACVWVGAAECYRNQGAVLSKPSEAMNKMAASVGRRTRPSGMSMDQAAVASTVLRRGGVTPFNVQVAANTASSSSSGASGHGAGTPFAVCDWWVRYLTPPGGTVLDMFSGAGTVGLAAHSRGMRYIGVEKDRTSIDASISRLEDATRQATMFGDGAIALLREVVGS